jgi:hypothetical protein
LSLGAHIEIGQQLLSLGAHIEIGQQLLSLENCLNNSCSADVKCGCGVEIVKQMLCMENYSTIKL